MKLSISENIKKFCINISIKEKQARREARNAYLAEICNKQINREKWGVGYSVFDGEELLEHSLIAIRPSVQYIVVVYQLVSWYGEPASPQLLPLLHELKKRGLIDELIEFKPTLGIKAIRNETAKRNMALKAARKAGCTFYMAMDADEFYREEEIDEAKKFIIMNDITHSYCSISTHGTRPDILLPTNTYFVQFFSRLSAFSKHSNDIHSVALVDPSRKMKHLSWWQGRNKHYVLHNVRMHHYSFIRKNLQQKFRNSCDPKIQVMTEDSVNSYEAFNCNDYFKLNKVVESWDKE